MVKFTLSNFTDKALEWEFADEQLSALLVTTDFTESDSSRTEAMRLLHTTSLCGGLTRLLGRELLAWGLATSRLAGGLLNNKSVNLRLEEDQPWSS